MDILCVFGRGIEKANGWHPTQGIERLSEKNGHSGICAGDLEMNSDDPRVVIAGSEFNAMAASELFSGLVSGGRDAPLVVFAAGRPNYLADDPDPTLTEGRIMKEYFVQRLEYLGHKAKEIIIFDKNKNTRDDVLQVLHLAKERGLRQITIVSVLVHLARCQEFYEFALKAEAGFRDYGVKFIAAEAVLMMKMPHVTSYLSQLLISKAYCRTAERERKGIEDLRAGRYNFGTQGYAFAPSKS